MSLSKQQKAAIKGSITSPEAAELLINKLEELAAANVTAISTADAIDLATTTALTNECKAKINAVIVALVAVGLMEAP